MPGLYHSTEYLEARAVHTAKHRIRAMYKVKLVWIYIDRNGEMKGGM